MKIHPQLTLRDHQSRERGPVCFFTLIWATFSLILFWWPSFPSLRRAHSFSRYKMFARAVCSSRMPFLSTARFPTSYLYYRFPSKYYFLSKGIQIRRPLQSFTEPFNFAHFPTIYIYTLGVSPFFFLYMPWV